MTKGKVVYSETPHNLEGKQDVFIKYLGVEVQRVAEKRPSTALPSLRLASLIPKGKGQVTSDKLISESRNLSLVTEMIMQPFLEMKT